MSCFLLCRNRSRFVSLILDVPCAWSASCFHLSPPANWLFKCYRDRRIKSITNYQSVIWLFPVLYMKGAFISRANWRSRLSVCVPQCVHLLLRDPDRDWSGWSTTDKTCSVGLDVPRWEFRSLVQVLLQNLMSFSVLLISAERIKSRRLPRMITCCVAFWVWEHDVLVSSWDTWERKTILQCRWSVKMLKVRNYSYKTWHFP